VNITLRQLKVFERVARRLSFTRAAEELYLTQPAVSMQIRQFEETIGLPLFERLGKKIYLTRAGEELYRLSRTISKQLNEAEELIEELKGTDGEHGSLFRDPLAGGVLSPIPQGKGQFQGDQSQGPAAAAGGQ
jgi:DNA-binding transcriptional LysR family regulator